ncbi:MAG: hypothetical protein K2K81_04760 [Muribaculaceae bacterium]|nr:hypothetical protein [Muribaculaceae bacterium]
MKKYISTPLILILGLLPILAITLPSCSHSSDSAPFRWPAVNSEIDSLSQKIDRMFYLREPAEEIGLRIDSLKKISRDSGKEALLADRISYFATYYSIYTGDEERYADGINRLLAEVDSSSNPYLYNRVLALAPDGERRDVDEYERLNGLLEYFRSKGDDIMTAHSLVNLGNLMKNVRDPRSAIKLYEEADSLCRANGMGKIASLNRLNLATVSFILRDTVKGVSILEEMRKDPIIRSDSTMMENVLHNLYIDGQVRDALDSLYAMKGERSNSLIETFMSNALLNEGDIRGAVSHAKMAVDKALADDNANDYAVALYAQADALSASGDTLKAYKSLIEAVELTDEIGNANEPEAIKDIETDRVLSMHRLEAELAKSRWQLRLVCIGFGLFILIGIGAFFVRKRIKRLRHQSREMSAEKEKIARKLVATQIVMDETDRILSTVGKAVVEMNDNNGASAQSREIASAIHTHKAKSTERETFIDSFSSVHPEFAVRLKEKNPAITEPDVRLASYIVTGMDNKMIASTMGIRPESVKQARWRLRSKLSLAKGASLEEALRKLNSPGS